MGRRGNLIIFRDLIEIPTVASLPRNDNVFCDWEGSKWTQRTIGKCFWKPVRRNFI